MPVTQFIIQAPYSSPITEVMLPFPDRSNTLEVAKQLIVNKLRRLTQPTHPTDGYVTYLRGEDQYELTYVFKHITIDKRYQLIQFFKQYSGDAMRIIDHNGTNWKVKLSSPNVQFAMVGLARDREGTDCIHSEAGEVTLRFTGVRI